MGRSILHAEEKRQSERTATFAWLVYFGVMPLSTALLNADHLFNGRSNTHPAQVEDDADHKSDQRRQQPAQVLVK